MQASSRNAWFSAICLIWAFTIPSTLDAASSHYTVTMANADGEKTALGYAEIDWDDNRRIAGRICAYDSSAEGDRNIRTDLGVISVEGVNARTGVAEIRLKLDAKASASMLASLVPDRIIKVEQNGRAGRSYRYSPQAILGWSDVNDALEKKAPWAPNEFSLEFEPLVKQLRQDDRFATIVQRTRGGKRTTRPFDLSRFDKMTIEQALAFRARTKFDELVAPGAVLVKYETASRATILAYLGRFGGLAKLVDSPPPDCGAPYVDDIVDVPPLLEFYFGRQFVRSGLFMTAFPEVYPKSPPFESITTGLRPIAEIFTDQSLKLEQKSSRLAAILEKEVLAFLDAKRPKFAGRWQLAPRKSGTPLGYRVQVIGAMTSQCARDGWEKFDVQFIPSDLGTGGRLSLLLQVVEGYEAPGALNERPSDQRFEDNRLKDDRLSKIQDALVQYLKGRGFRQEFPDDAAAQRNDPCQL